MKKLFTLLFLLITVNVNAATFYVANNPCSGNAGWGNGSNSNNGTAKSTPFLTLQYAIGEMSSNDTIIIDDGTYTGDNNRISNTVHPPDGTSGNFTTIQAENDGQVTFDGEGARSMFYVDGNSAGNCNYLKFVGIIWCKSATTDAAFIQGTDGTHNTYIYFSKCGFHDGAYTSNTSWNGLNIRRTDYALVEDCYVWGEVYYGILFERNLYSIMRRCVGRYDIHRGERGGMFGVYSSSNCEVQNCIVLDCDQPNAYTGVTEFMYGFAFPTTDGPSANVHLRGCIGLNLIADGEIISSLISANSQSSGFTITDCVFWNTSGGFWDRGTDYSTGATVTNSLFGSCRGSVITEAFIGGSQVSNTIFTNNTMTGFYNDVPTQDYNCLYSNNPNYHASGERGAHDYCSENSNAINPLTNSLLYLTRIEAGSSLITAGSSGTRVGPQILYQIGTTGTFYSQTGYNTTTAINLWPFPQEDLIRTKFAAYTGNVNATVSGARGFCADEQTLTKYIWEYLGNTIPDEIYGESPADTTAPGTTSSLQASTGGSVGSVNLTWTAPGDDNTTGTATSYDVRYSTATITEENWASATTVTGEPTPSAAGTTENLTVGSLTAGTTYYFALKTTDDNSNVSALSNVANASAAVVPPMIGNITLSNVSFQ